MTNGEPTPLRAGHRGNAGRLRAKVGEPVGASGDLSRITPEHIRQAEENLSRRPRRSLALSVTQSLALATTMAMFGVIIGWAVQNDEPSIVVFAGIGVACVMTSHLIQLLRRQ